MFLKVRFSDGNWDYACQPSLSNECFSWQVKVCHKKPRIFEMLLMTCERQNLRTCFRIFFPFCVHAPLCSYCVPCHLRIGWCGNATLLTFSRPRGMHSGLFVSLASLRSSRATTSHIPGHATACPSPVSHLFFSFSHSQYQ